MSEVDHKLKYFSTVINVKKLQMNRQTFEDATSNKSL